MQNLWLAKRKFPKGTKVRILREGMLNGAFGEIMDIFLNDNFVPLAQVRFTSLVNGIDGKLIEFYYFYLSQLEEHVREYKHNCP